MLFCVCMYCNSHKIVTLFDTLFVKPCDKMMLKHHISFKLRPYGEKPVYQIQMHSTFNGVRLRTSTGCLVENLAAWNTESEIVRSDYRGPKGETAMTINDILRNCREQMELAFRFFEANDIVPTKAQVEEKYLSRIKGTVPQKPKSEPKKEAKPKEPQFFEVYQMFLSECGEKNAWTEAGLTAFVRYLREEKVLKTPRKKKGDRTEYDRDDLIGLKNSSIEKKLGYLRWFLNWATDRGYNTNIAYKTFRPTLKSTQKKVIYLTKEEILKMKNLVLPGGKEYLDPIRDVFLFCCFTGLRHSDAYGLRRTDVKGNHIEVTTVKTADSLSIELNDVSRSILDKYRDVDFKDNHALPFYTNQAMNRDIKELCRLAGIDEMA